MDCFLLLEVVTYGEKFFEQVSVGLTGIDPVPTGITGLAIRTFGLVGRT
jgi:hypothetical protein